MAPSGGPLSEVLERRAGRNGELVLRRDGDHLEIISNGTFLMDTRDGRSERLLAAAPLDLVGPRARVLIGGLGVGFTLAAALAHRHTAAVTVLEIEPAVLAWHRTHLGPRVGDPLADPRVEVVVADLADWLVGSPERYDVLCLDVDNGPGWTVTAANRRLYDAAGLDLLATALEPAGVLAVWSAADDPAFATALAARFGAVRTLPVPVPRGEPDVLFLAAAATVLG